MFAPLAELFFQEIQLYGAEVIHLQLYSSDLTPREYVVLWDIWLTAFEYLAEVRAW